MSRHSRKTLGNRSGFVVLAAFATILFLMIPSLCFAQARWQENGIAVCTAATDQGEQQLTTDGNNGAIVTWSDFRNAATTGADIYAQRALAGGTVDPDWTANGVRVCNAGGDQFDPQIVADGVGGAYITWRDERVGPADPDVFLQRVDAGGALHAGWAADGQPVCVLAGVAAREPQLLPDGTGGVYVTWQDDRVGAGDYDIYAQRIDGDGGVHAGWAVNGQPVAVVAGAVQRVPQVVSDGAGGAIITWEDERSLPGDFDIYAQRIDPDGTVHAGWAATGQPVSVVAGSVQFDQHQVADGQGGIVAAWTDERAGVANRNIYAMRIDAGGAPHDGWAANGVAICSEAGEQRSSRLTSDGRQGAIITWQDQRAGNWDIFVQEIDGAGDVQWAADGVPLTDNTFNQVLPKIVDDGYYGAIVTWQGKPTTHDNIFAQRVNWNGVPQWAENGAVVCDAAGDQLVPEITGDGQGGSIIAWVDRRAGNADIYAQRESDYGFNWYLAEGSTGTNENGSFETWVLVQNPGAETAHVQLFYQTPEEEIDGPTLTLDPQTRQTVNVGDTVPNRFSVSTRVLADQPVVAERAMYWSTLAGVNRQAAHDSIGVTGPSYNWFLAEGSTGTNEQGSFETWILVQNPGDVAADVQLWYQTPDEEIEGQQFTLAPHTRETRNVGDVVPNQFSVSTRVEADQPVVAERAMYWSTLAGVNRQAATDSIGVTMPDRLWYLAEGSTGTNESGTFETWILVQNPGDVPADVVLWYQTPDEEIEGQHITLAPHTRETRNVGDVVPNQFSVSTRVESDQPVIAERAMYWSTLAGVNRQAAHDSIGVTLPAFTWDLAEGSTGTNENGSFETWILLQNPGDDTAQVTLWYQTPDEEIEGQHITLGPRSRQTVNAADVVPNQFSVSTRVVSTHMIIAERAMYWSTLDGVNRQAATDSIGFTSH